jgi:hypothetical protein
LTKYIPPFFAELKRSSIFPFMFNFSILFFNLFTYKRSPHLAIVTLAFDLINAQYSMLNKERRRRTQDKYSKIKNVANKQK